MEYPWPKIENRKRIVLDKIEHYHPDDPRHTPYWRELKRKAVEGFWIQDWGQWRFIPGRLFFYGNFCTILDVDEEQNVRRRIRPRIRDLEVERSYLYLEAEGFSGFKGDDKYTSNRNILDIRKDYDPLTVTSDPQYFQSNGKFKEFIDPRDNIRMLRDEPVGVPYYNNDCRNIIELGSRGGGKSYWYALAGIKYRLCFDGIKYYNPETRANPPTVEMVIGSGNTDKSSEFARKVYESMNELAIANELGAWGKIGDQDYEPSPFYKEMKGSLKPNNKENAWRHEYSMKINGRWIEGFGTGSKVYHVNYSINKREGAEAAAGGRYTDVITEEVGLTELAIEAYNSNRATVTVGTHQFGVQIFLGTSGNMETVIPAKKIFSNPVDYECLEFPDYWEGTGKIGFFLPAYMTADKFRDENGNCDIEKAKEYYEKRRKKAAKSDDPSVLRVERMNFPLVPTDMWQTQRGSILPVKEAEEREKQLIKEELHKKLGVNVKLHWTTEGEVDYDIHHDADPYYEWPLESNQQRTSLEGTITIYDFPFKERGLVPNDMYFMTHDPYISDEWDRGGSLGVVHVWLNPKYWSTHMPSVGPMVATYIGKAPNGKKEFYNNVEKLMHFYGNPTRGLAFESNAGEYCRSYFERKDKLHLLMLRPYYVGHTKVRQNPVLQYGFQVGNKLQKISMIDDLADLLLQEIEIAGIKKKLIHTIPCIFSVRQIKAFILDENFDAVSSMLGAPIYIRELTHRAEQKLKKQGHNPIGFLSANQRLFGQTIQNGKERRETHRW
jgi:hypothetical protein